MYIPQHLAVNHLPFDWQVKNSYGDVNAPEEQSDWHSGVWDVGHYSYSVSRHELWSRNCFYNWHLSRLGKIRSQIIIATHMRFIMHKDNPNGIKMRILVKSYSFYASTQLIHYYGQRQKYQVRKQCAGFN